MIAIALLAACKGSGSKDKEPVAPAPPAPPAKTAGPVVPTVKVDTVLAMGEKRVPFLLLVDEAGTVRLAAAKSWADVDANKLVVAKRAGDLRQLDPYMHETVMLGRDPVEAIAGWDKGGDDIDLTTLEDTKPRGGTAQDDPPPPPEEDESGGTGTAMALDEGKMGKKDSDRAEGQYKMQKNQDDPQLARQQAIEQARAAGILGSPTGSPGGAFASLTRGVPNEDGMPSRNADIGGAVRPDGTFDRLRAMIVIAPTAKASTLIEIVRVTEGAIAVVHDGKVRPFNLDFGLRDRAVDESPRWLEVRVSSKGFVVEAVPDKPFETTALDQLGATLDKARTTRGYDPDAPVDVLVDPDVDVQHLVDVLAALEVAHVKAIGIGGPLSAEALAARGHRTPATALGQPNAQGDLDKALIRKTVKGAKAKLTYCYEKALISDPSLKGTVQVQFFITPKGKVASAAGNGVSPEVSGCVADVIKSLTFPKPKGGGGVQVNYPFTFHQ